MTTTLERPYSPQTVSPPGETLKETLSALCMKQTDLAKRTGRSTKNINEIIKGKAPLTPETALQIAAATGVPAEFWNSREARYREHLAAKEESKSLASETGWLTGFPVARMCKLGWVPKASTKVDQLRLLLKFLGIASPDRFEACQAQFKRSPALKHDPNATHAWLRKGVLEAQKVSCRSYSADAFRAALLEIRQTLTVTIRELIPLIQEKCARAGVAVVFVRELPNTGGSGATQWTGGRPIAQLSCRYRTADHLIFTFFHESEHILRHGHGVFIEGGREGAEAQKEEDEANRGAADRLIPPAEYERFIAVRPITKSRVAAFASELRVPPGVIVGRLQRDKKIKPSVMNDLKEKVGDDVMAALWA